MLFFQIFEFDRSCSCATQTLLWFPNVAKSGPNSCNFKVSLRKFSTLAVDNCSRERLSSLSPHLANLQPDPRTSGSPGNLAHRLKTRLLALKAQGELRVRVIPPWHGADGSQTLPSAVYLQFFAASGPPLLPLLVIQPRLQTHALSTREKL